MSLLLRWETEALLESLALPVKNIEWKEAPGDNYLGFDLKAFEFTTEQLGMMAQMNKEMQEG